MISSKSVEFVVSRRRKKNNTLHVFLICRPGLGPAHNKHNKTQMQITMTQIQITIRKITIDDKKKTDHIPKKYTWSENERKSTAGTYVRIQKKVVAQTTHNRTRRSTHSNHSKKIT